jgi:hypothetical protein
VQVAQHLRGGRERTGVRDAVEIGRNVEHGGVVELRSSGQPGAAVPT